MFTGQCIGYYTCIRNVAEDGDLSRPSVALQSAATRPAVLLPRGQSALIAFRSTRHGYQLNMDWPRPTIQLPRALAADAPCESRRHPRLSSCAPRPRGTRPGNPLLIGNVAHLSGIITCRPSPPRNTAAGALLCLSIKQCFNDGPTSADIGPALKQRTVPRYCFVELHGTSFRNLEFCEIQESPVYKKMACFRSDSGPILASISA